MNRVSQQSNLTKNNSNQTLTINKEHLSQKLEKKLSKFVESSNNGFIELYFQEYLDVSKDAILVYKFYDESSWSSCLSRDVEKNDDFESKVDEEYCIFDPNCDLESLASKMAYRLSRSTLRQFKDPQPSELIILNVFF